MTKYIVIMGNPVEGLLYMGPYASWAEAATDMPNEGDWWVAELIAPEDMADKDLPRLTERLLKKS